MHASTRSCALCFAIDAAFRLRGARCERLRSEAVSVVACWPRRASLKACAATAWASAAVAFRCPRDARPLQPLRGARVVAIITARAPRRCRAAAAPRRVTLRCCSCNVGASAQPHSFRLHVVWCVLHRARVLGGAARVVRTCHARARPSVRARTHSLHVLATPHGAPVALAASCVPARCFSVESGPLCVASSSGTA